MVRKRLVGHLKAQTGLSVFAYEANDKAKMPYIVYQVNGQNERLAVNGGVIQTDYLIELDVYSSDSEESETLKEKIINALLNFERPATSIKCHTEPDDKSVLLTIEFEFFV